ncbi:MAG TPA: hypothetical protein VMA72_02840 [Streptosporangiaceae bacterium]|nr:hypothetical protein [Streptosporangiaceae bacterium]
MTRSAAARSASYAAGISEIRSLLAGTDPAVAEPTAADSARLSLVSGQVTAARETSGHGRTWWPARQYRRHRKIVITSIAVPAVLAGTAAGWVIAASPSPSQLTNAVVCYSLPHPPGIGVLEYAAGGTDPGIAPVAFCAQQWAAGQVIPGVHRVPPHLAACAMPNPGAVGVFPDTTCMALHLPPVPAGFIKAVRKFTALQKALISPAGSRCLSESAAMAFTRRIAAAHGFGRWRIVQPKTAPPGLCWHAQAQPQTHVIDILAEDGVYPRSNEVARIVERVMAPLYTRRRCRPGSQPESAAAIRSELLTRLREAGFKGWKVVVESEPASKLSPCYVSAGPEMGVRVVPLNTVAYGP